MQRVRSIRRAQDLGFTLQEIRDLLALQTDTTRSCGAVEQWASVTLQRMIDERSRSSDAMRTGGGLWSLDTDWVAPIAGMVFAMRVYEVL